MNNSGKLRYNFNDPLNEGDSDEKTLGCRAFQPDFCSDYGSSGCALVNESGICTNPRKSWKKQYHKLLEGKNGVSDE